MKKAPTHIDMSLACVRHCYNVLRGEDLPDDLAFGKALREMVIEFGAEKILEAEKSFSTADFLDRKLSWQKGN